uniref:MD-2-related lipid-recognition domain-containing protein n=2 Tax=Clytia hemisphaerica TaxID=252671 RepID=A0A7M5WVL8_9CNID
MKGTPTPTGCFTKRKLAIVGIAVAVLVLVGYVLRERYFYRADVLIAIQTNVQHARKVVGNKIGNKGILGFLNFGGKNNVGETDDKKIKTNVWDEWMIKQTAMTSIGDIYDHCDNTTRTKIGKVVLQPKPDGKEGVQIKSYLNQTYKYEITSSSVKMEVFYNDELFMSKNKDMCEEAKLLDTPYSCPIKAGYKLVIEDVAKLPSYIPKGKYRIFSIVYDQDKKEIGCTFIDFKTGENV